jgi:hypothetical protein
VKWYRLAIEGLEDDYERLRPKAVDGSPDADDDIREGERKTPAMRIRHIVRENLKIVRERFVEALRSGEIASVPQKADTRRQALRKILEDLTDARGKALEELIGSLRGCGSRRFLRWLGSSE